MVIDREPNANGSHHLTVLTTATLFKHGDELEAEVIYCDFHYNLIVVRVESNCSMPVANMKFVDDVLPMDPDEMSYSCVFSNSSHILIAPS
ncbi:unnamed protein product [Cuscuta campestris]|uniref:Uncharacterized protein n=1 Tax=Cuscuta campestris TaxID=132261 RepID=A0A484NJR2_9ASTE|nr:unnamed protein product [Cuscuta campestris]